MKNPDDVDPDDDVLPEYDSSEHHEAAEMLNEIRVAEEQIARGEGIEHDEAKRRVLARLRIE
jgi:hypothetical protein